MAHSQSSQAHRYEREEEKGASHAPKDAVVKAEATSHRRVGVVDRSHFVQIQHRFAGRKGAVVASADAAVDLTR